MLVSAAWIVPAILGAVDSLAQQRIWNQPTSYRAALFTALDWLLYGVLTPFVFLLARRLPLTSDAWRRHASIHVAFSLGFCVVWASLGTLLKLALQPGEFGGGITASYLSWIFITLPFGVAVYLAVVGIEHAVRYFVEARERETQLARLSEQLSGARLAALQAQLNPHFLFNSLNTIAVLVRGRDNAAATRVVEQLSEVLRATLGRSRNSEVSLDEELGLVRQYLAVEQARFSDRLAPQIDVAPSLLAAAVPSFAIQHLVENAIRHGIARRTASGNVRISARTDGDFLEIVVADDGAGPAGEPLPGHGIANTRERLRTLYGDRASLALERVGGETRATLRVPFHEIALVTESRDAR